LLDEDTVQKLGRQILSVNVMEEDEKGSLRHNSRKLGRALFYWYRQQKSEVKEVREHERSAS
jgi:hypothetical protein